MNKTKTTDKSRASHHRGVPGLGSAIKQLRKDCAFTQVDFAAALDLTPASIYRYEAGSTDPSQESLAKLYRFAVEHRHGPAEYILHRAIERSAIHLNDFSALESMTVLQARASSLSDTQLVLVLALMRLIAEPDKAVHNVLRALAEPYMEQARAELATPRNNVKMTDSVEKGIQ